MISIIQVLREVLKFSPKMFTLHEGIEEYRIIQFEKNHNVVLPNDYKMFLKKTNGLDFMGIVVFGIYDGSAYFSLDKSYKFEHYDVDNAMPMNLIPFSPDGGGNHYCFDSSNCDSNSCKIVFWQHDLVYTLHNPPEIVNGSFTKWMKEVIIDWTLEDYDYEGNKR